MKTSLIQSRSPETSRPWDRYSAASGILFVGLLLAGTASSGRDQLLCAAPGDGIRPRTP